jgi:hypothetical protein
MTSIYNIASFDFSCRHASYQGEVAVVVILFPCFHTRFNHLHCVSCWVLWLDSLELTYADFLNVFRDSNCEEDDVWRRISPLSPSRTPVHFHTAEIVIEYCLLEINACNTLKVKRHFGGICHLNLLSRRINRARNQGYIPLLWEPQILRSGNFFWTLVGSQRWKSTMWDLRFLQRRLWRL